jgi:hypothetical protein
VIAICIVREIWEDMKAAALQLLRQNLTVEDIAHVLRISEAAARQLIEQPEESP